MTNISKEKPVTKAVKTIFKKIRYWELPGFHEAMTDKEVITVARKIKNDKHN